MKKLAPEILFLFCFLMFNACSKEEPPVEMEEEMENEMEVEIDTDAEQGWVLIKKEQINNTGILKEFLGENDLNPTPLEPYPISLNFTDTASICGHHDANLYRGSYSISESNQSISLSIGEVTDVGSPTWYWDFLNDISSYITNYEILNFDTLRLSNDSGSLTYVLLRRDYEDLYNIYYQAFDGQCAFDTANISNSLQGSTWIVWCRETYTSQAFYETFTQPNDDPYPISLTLSQDSLYGRHAENIYQADLIKDEMNIEISNFNSSNNEDNDWYLDYKDIFDQMTQCNTLGEEGDTLQLSTIDGTTTFYYLSKVSFKQNHFDIDSLYGL